MLFAPYDVRVVRQDSAITAVDFLTGHTTDDTLIFVTGNEDPAGAGGVAPIDPNNTRDDIGASGGCVGMARWIVQSGWAGPAGRDAFINFLSGATAHEGGHTFGLDHVSEPAYTNRDLMTAFAGFEVHTTQDVTYPLDDGGVQNSHQYMNNIIGPSAGGWAAVLTPGKLTIRGTSGIDDVTILPNPSIAGTWIVNVNSPGISRAYYINPTATPDFNSFNTFPAAITQIQFVGGSGNDRFVLGVPLTGGVTFDGQAGTERWSSAAPAARTPSRYLPQVWNSAARTSTPRQSKTFRSMPVVGMTPSSR